ncbi:MAG: PQQ-binding-like beta-propeller repeat protein [Actinobacteria bacterium]|nr:PQQ-binding-like beta-propeller repeat protein [Actinomycetota bacterium]
MATTLAVAAVAVVACGSSSGHAARPAARTASASSTTTRTAAVARAASGGSAWKTYGGSSSRAGIVPGAPSNPSLHKRFELPVDGEVYAEPLIAGGRIYVATENDTVYAFTTGGQLVWKRHLGSPVPGGDLPCGNIDPSGITGTPVIAGGRLFAVAFLHSGHKHVLFGLRLSDGTVAVHGRVDPPNRLAQQERGALLATHGRIYVPYGGLYGDCGTYHGYVISRTESGGSKISYKNPATEASIWAPAGMSTQSGTLLVSTGNGGAGSFGYQNSVIRLSRDLHRLAYWAPTNWASLSAGDVDEGSLAPLPVSHGRVFQIGKNGVGELLNHDLGGVGKEQFGGPVCGSEALGADAFRAPIAIVPCGGSLYALHIGAKGFHVAWQNSAGGSVPIIAGNSVFALTKDGTLNQFRFSDGHLLKSTTVGSGSTSFPPLAAAGKTLVAPSEGKVVVFSL